MQKVSYDCLALGTRNLTTVLQHGLLDTVFNFKLFLKGVLPFSEIRNNDRDCIMEYFQKHECADFWRNEGLLFCLKESLNSVNTIEVSEFLHKFFKEF